MTADAANDSAQGPAAANWHGRKPRWLEPYLPRFRDPRFWAVQGLVAIVSALHYFGEVTDSLGYSPAFHSVSFVHVSLFLVPVVYASLNFGFAGTGATAVLVAAVTIPNIILFHEGVGRFAESINLATVVAIALFVGQRVDRETSARQRAEAAGAALSASEAKYRGLFQSSPAAILLVDPQGTVVEANPASGSLFKVPPARLRGTSLAELVGRAGAESLLGPRPEGRRAEHPVLLSSRDGRELLLAPELTQAVGPGGEAVVQVVLRDVTSERRLQEGLRAYAAYVQRAQEEERKRVAQELHDDSVQSLVLLVRQLDLAESQAAAAAPSMVPALGKARRSAEEVVSKLRDFARALRPTALEDLGLVAAVRRVAADTSERAGIDVRLVIQGGERRLSPDIELGLFRITQEALRNVERHAHAKSAKVMMTFGPEEVVAQVTDDGVGFVPPADLRPIATGHHLGLLGIQERAELLGGRIEIASTPGKGTTVTAHIPVVTRQAP